MLADRQCTITAPSMTLLSWVKGGSGCPGSSRHPSRSDLVLGKLNLPKFYRGWGNDCISCAKNSARSPSSFCTDTIYNWPQNVTLFCSVSIFFPCLNVFFYRGCLKSAREFLLIGSLMEWLRTSITFLTNSRYSTVSLGIFLVKDRNKIEERWNFGDTSLSTLWSTY